MVDQILDFEAEVVPEEIVAPMLLNLCVRLRSLQASNNFVLLLYLLPLLLPWSKYSEEKSIILVLPVIVFKCSNGLSNLCS